TITKTAGTATYSITSITDGAEDKKLYADDGKTEIGTYNGTTVTLNTTGGNLFTNNATYTARYNKTQNTTGTGETGTGGTGTDEPGTTTDTTTVNQKKPGVLIKEKGDTSHITDKRIVTEKNGSEALGNTVYDLEKGVGATIYLTVEDVADNTKKLKSVDCELQTTADDGTVSSTKQTAVYDETQKAYKLVLNNVQQLVTVEVTPTYEAVEFTPSINTTNLKNAKAVLVDSNGEAVTGKVKSTDTGYKLKITPDKDATIEGAYSINGASSESFEDKSSAFEIPVSVDVKKGLNIVVQGGKNNNTEVANDNGGAAVKAPYNVAINGNDLLTSVTKPEDAGKVVYTTAAVSVASKASDQTLGDYVSSYLGKLNESTTADTQYKTACVVDVDIKKGVGADLAAAKTAAAAAKEETSINSPVNVVVTLPAEAQGKSNYKVITVHDGVKRELPYNGNTFTSNGNTITLSVKDFSEFAIVYQDGESTNTNGGSTTDGTTTDPTQPTTPDANPTDNGAVTPANPAATAGATTAKADEAKKAPVAPTAPAAKKLSAKTGSPKTADYAVNSLLALLTGAAGLFGISLMNSKKRKDEDQ
ncbi:hypothetical protein SAMN04487761_1631, partial [Lachnospiraceae bacterium C7]